MIVWFSHARAALLTGLRSLDLPRGSGVLLPDYICDVVVPPVIAAGLKPHFYEVRDDFTVGWDQICALRSSETRALLLVHYFGQPADVARAMAICSERKWLLVEDAAHGFGGTVDGVPLGALGDVGIASPRKICGTYSGAVLYRSGEIVSAVGLDTIPVSPLRKFDQCVLRRFPIMRRGLREMMPPRMLPMSPFDSDDHANLDYACDPLSAQELERFDWNSEAERRRNAWSIGVELAVRLGLKPVWESAAPASCPWIMPAYAKNVQDRNRAIAWCANRRIGAYTWPTLSRFAVERNPLLVHRWERLMCIDMNATINILAEAINELTNRI